MIKPDRTAVLMFVGAIGVTAVLAGHMVLSGFTSLRSPGEFAFLLFGMPAAPFQTLVCLNLWAIIAISSVLWLGALALAIFGGHARVKLAARLFVPVVPILSFFWWLKSLVIDPNW